MLTSHAVASVRQSRIRRCICFAGSSPETPDPTKKDQEGTSGSPEEQTPMVYNPTTGTMVPEGKAASPSNKGNPTKSNPDNGRRKAARDARAGAAEGGAGVETQQRAITNSNVLELDSVQLSSVQKYLRGENLSTSEKSILRTVPISQWAKIAQTVDSTSSPLITFSVAPDHILRITLYLRNNSRKVFSRNVLSKLSGEEVFVAPDVQNLNPETFNLSFHFGVLENTLNPDWLDVLIYFKDMLYSGFYREVTPDYINLESINIKVITPTGEEPINKVYSALERGNLTMTETIEENMLYTYNMYSSVLVSNRNQFQIRLPHVGANCPRDVLEEEVADRLESTVKLMSSNLVMSSPNAPGQVVFRLLINTQKKEAVSAFFPVDSIQSIGFTAPRVIRAKKPRRENKAVEGGKS